MPQTSSMTFLEDVGPRSEIHLQASVDHATGLECVGQRVRGVRSSQRLGSSGDIDDVPIVENIGHADLELSLLT